MAKLTPLFYGRTAVIEIAVTWIAAVLVSTLIWWQMEQANHQLRQATIAQAYQRAHQINVAIGNQVSTLFQFVDHATLELAQRYAQDSLDHFDRAVRRTAERLPAGSLVQVAVGDAAGEVVYSSLGIRNRVSIADREHFKAHLGTRVDHLFISRPVLGRVSKAWSIQFTRAIRRGGRFGGVLVVSIAPAYLQTALAEATLDTGDTLTVIRNSGEYLALNRDHAGMLGTSIDPSRPFLGPNADSDGSFIATDADGITRLYSWVRLARYPVSIVLGLNEDAILKPVEESVRQGRWQTAGVLALLAAVSLGISVLSLRMAKQREIVRRSERLALTARVFQNSYEGFIISNANNEIIEVNQGFTDITGYRREDIIGRDPNVLSSGRHAREFYAQMWQAIESTGFWRGEIWNRRKDGEVYAELLSISVVRDDQGQVTNYIGVFSDINQLKKREAELARRADHDALTGLPNRRLALDRLEQLIAVSKRAGETLAVCYLDLDGFKPINDRFGHKAGDQVLMEVAARMQSGLRAGDTVARIGGDEFLLLLGNIGAATDLADTLQRLLRAIQMPIQVDNQQAAVSASIGVTTVPPDDPEVESLIRHADNAMYVAKHKGKDRYHVFTPAA